jgi:crossover junction endodeoxyribonuclease RuvC
LGVDPGLAQTGFGIIDYDKSKCRFHHVTHGVIETPADEKISERLKTIYNKIKKIAAQYKPDEASIEAIYFAKNALSAIHVAHTIGVVYLLFSQKNILVKEYSPIQIKQSVVGNGRAEKNQVQEMVKMLLKLDKIPKPDHASDALAAAICHCNNRSIISG